MPCFLWKKSDRRVNNFKSRDTIHWSPLKLRHHVIIYVELWISQRRNSLFFLPSPTSSNLFSTNGILPRRQMTSSLIDERHPPSLIDLQHPPSLIDEWCPSLDELCPPSLGKRCPLSVDKRLPLLTNVSPPTNSSLPRQTAPLLMNRSLPQWTAHSLTNGSLEWCFLEEWHSPSLVDKWLPSSLEEQHPPTMMNGPSLDDEWHPSSTTNGTLSQWLMAPSLEKQLPQMASSLPHWWMVSSLAQLMASSLAWWTASSLNDPPLTNGSLEWCTPWLMTGMLSLTWQWTVSSPLNGQNLGLGKCVSHLSLSMFSLNLSDIHLRFSVGYTSTRPVFTTGQTWR